MIRIIFGLFLLLMIPASSFAFAEHIFNPNAYAQYLDISQLESEKITFTFDEKSYDIYYGYRGSLDSMGSNELYPVLFSMEINQEKKSIEIIMDVVPEKTDFWVRTPQDVLYAENEKYTVLVDGVDTRYDLMKFPNDYVIGFIISEDTKKIEIIGTRVIPEFGVYAILILGVSILGLIYFARKSSIVSQWTRIN
ncbi:MAG: PEFG-CTERM sorting domain-containing protein [Nitrosopumilus sp.]|uniref:PEFG-CTERM sorting domain-containing protein n=1 Tax=Nitrosopumilus sp. TaxID=2024843 RepID=UPI002472E539|nr:PEFG-CTERM sorting domain-containing protein [Nitrosopumilus sp.]MDH5430917.1 PEFG-CTERM sorting domain-containing protein [Nitrosopumilus sp.]MDH5698072.1 PEFG-CTERM sorting domain-containing protein [Nitrosopumilus sp.]